VNHGFRILDFDKQREAIPRSESGFQEIYNIMIRFKRLLVLTAILTIICSCEEVIDIDLNYAESAFVAEAKLYKDSVCLVSLSKTIDYFSSDEPEYVDDAIIKISDGVSSEELNYMGNGNYCGENIIGTEEKTYQLEILHNGLIYSGTSYMPEKVEIISIQTYKSESQSIFNPDGEVAYTISCSFNDNPATDNYYMVCYIADGELIEERYFLLTENSANGGSIENSNNILNFSESIFYQGGEISVQLYSIDKTVYNYFKQLDDILFWKRRVMPPTPYNPKSNISNGALGYFAALAYDSERILLE
jgi:hypothetical protein